MMPSSSPFIHQDIFFQPFLYSNPKITTSSSSQGSGDDDEDNIPLSAYCTFPTIGFTSHPFTTSSRPPLRRPSAPPQRHPSEGYRATWQARRPSQPAINQPAFELLEDTSDDDDEDDVPIGVLQGQPSTNRKVEYQSAAEKYKEKVRVWARDTSNNAI
ncbi:uncharacterized protein BYT42DRAFT_577662 [Radiomyces spectabilis]|uniref:uncharacterized protein n=1 Tax=Radiomyces spectabilis TaxID=64574 RepID=UPI00221FE4DB|nr:uncharacterized protein BYT42DRAFT_577662 [Radiomyces spectabilis]KAI8372694.1 hypothetical protein BYT42DRAFT_577662 [Radiomyces spectabilis]